MTEVIESITPGHLYHIYNRGINSCNLFEGEADYLHFLSLCKKIIEPVADFYAWVLMPNHFHWLVYIKEDMVYKYSKEDIERANALRFDDTDNSEWEINKWETITFHLALKEKGDPSLMNNKVPNPSKHFSHLFNAYSKFFNTKYKRHGALFERRFKRKVVDSERYLKQGIIYIHNNPKHHGFVSDAIEYPWSSYSNYLEEKDETIKDQLVRLFGNKTNFKNSHQRFYNDIEWE